MFKRLQQKWGVSTRQFWILFLAFALTGTTTAILTRYVTGWLGMTQSTPAYQKVLLRIGMLLFGYQVVLLLYGALLGEWAFFWQYERKLLHKLGVWRLGSGARRTRIAVFASGTGSNAAKIIEYIKGHREMEVALIACNRMGAGVIGIAESNRIPVLIIEKERFFRGDAYVSELKARKIGFIVLAGFLWKVPEQLVQAFSGHIINIHPALLPKYGGKGMYGQFVHEAVIRAAEKESGITIHYVNEHFDEGAPIFQASCELEPGETAESLAKKIHALEHAHFPRVVAEAVMKSRHGVGFSRKDT